MICETRGKINSELSQISKIELFGKIANNSFSASLSRLCLWTELRKSFANKLLVVTHGTCNQDRTCFLGHTGGKYFDVLLIVTEAGDQYSFNMHVLFKAHLQTVVFYLLTH